MTTLSSHEIEAPEGESSDLLRHGFQSLIGGSELLQQVIQKARLLAHVDTALFLPGETGTGKEFLARAIHEHGPRRAAPFVAVNCGGLPAELIASELFGCVDAEPSAAERTGLAGKLEAAHGGTVFLDDVSALPLDVQALLLGVLERGELYPVGSTDARFVDFRLIAATACDMRREVQAQRFRTDLFYRIAETTLRVPSLRERKEDIPALVAHFSSAATRRFGSPARSFATSALEAFSAYPWPGNLRELRNVVETMLLLSDSDPVDASAIPVDLLATAQSAATRGDEVRTIGGLRVAERETIDGSIRMHRGNLTNVARDLGISRSTLYLKLRKYGLQHALQDVRTASIG